MIGKDKLLELIDVGLRTEEKAIPLYMKHVSATVPWFGFTDKQRQHIVETLRGIGRESEGHKATLTSARQKIVDGGRDVY